jgi:glycosyltransferase involved in cell wall biosynthesis
MLLPESLALHDQSEFEFHYIYFLPWKNQMVEALTERGGKVTCFDASNNIQLMLKAGAVARYVKDNEIQTIHAHLPWAGILARFVRKLTGVPVIYTEHNKQERYHFATRLMNLATMNWLNEVIAVSADVEQSIRKFKPGLKAHLQTIVNGVNTRHFTPGIKDGKALRKSMNMADHHIVIGTIAVFRFQKRLDLWLQIAQKIHERNPNTRFVIVGDGPLKSQLYEKADQLKLKEVVHFAGLQTEVRNYIAAFDVYMMTSIFEGLPIALLEAMSSACPVITTDAGGIKEVIRNDFDGLMCDVNDPEKLIDFALALAENPQRRKTLGDQGRTRIQKDFSLSEMVRKTETLYRNIVK